VRCPGLTNPCSAHGVAPGDHLSVHVYPTPASFWKGASCDACMTGWSAPQCRACPTYLGVPATPATGSAQMRRVLLPLGTAARRAQNPDSAASAVRRGTSTQRCSGGVWPGGAATPCSGHGLCSQGTDGDGKCVCAFGYTGPHATPSAPADGVNPCQGHGTCGAATNCRCSRDPQRPLRPGASLNACSGHGTCFACSTNLAECTCVAEYVSADCSGICPGVLATPCNNKGVYNRNGTCACYAANSTGVWVGATCNACAAAAWESTATCSALPLRRGGDDGAGPAPRPRGPPRHRARRAITARDGPRRQPGRDGAATRERAQPRKLDLFLSCSDVEAAAADMPPRLDDDAVEP
jgi:hypothetical protein